MPSKQVPMLCKDWKHAVGDLISGRGETIQGRQWFGPFLKKIDNGIKKKDLILPANPPPPPSLLALQQAMATPYICAQRATARHFNLNTNVTYSQRELDVIDTYAATMRQLEGVTNDTAMISYLAARKVCTLRMRAGRDVQRSRVRSLRRSIPKFISERYPKQSMPSLAVREIVCREQVRIDLVPVRFVQVNVVERQMEWFRLYQRCCPSKLTTFIYVLGKSMGALSMQLPIKNAGLLLHH
jgi:hypothetical protein